MIDPSNYEIDETRIFQDHRLDTTSIYYYLIESASYCPIDSSPSRPSNKNKTDFLCVLRACISHEQRSMDVVVEGIVVRMMNLCVKIFLRNS